ncbi:hypothetical protein G7Y89_g1111 [Cudoniella acicularis]|uniref:DUF7703 domain-containing protein n=1 Tax=Cudoniella acicularis TaxID=354080 RepID=A0A8H4RX04_9HELO|nr:hypothetical protein G7Y89_g1111 [Cudoniella acicularis]
MTDAGIGKNSVDSLTTTITIVVFVAIALYNVAELNFIIFGTFKRRSGLYFWSFLVSTWGIAIYSIGFLIKDMNISSQGYFYVTFIIVGWCFMVTGQSVVLYSRLHLVLQNTARLRLVLGMIIINGIICHTPTIVMVYGANSNNPEPFLLPYSICERVQVTIFFIQELVISGLYIFHTVKILRPEGGVRGRTARRIMGHLIYVNVIIVVLDITILGLEYSGLYDIQTAYKGLVYSVKLKLEFSILNRLIELAQSNRVFSHNNSSDRHVVPLETFDGDRLKQQTVGSWQGSGYRAYVYTGGVKDASFSGAVNQDDSVVVMTTEIGVRSHGNDERIDLESIGTKSNVTTESVVAEPGVDHLVLSSSSSQVKFASLGH